MRLHYTYNNPILSEMPRLIPGHRWSLPDFLFISIIKLLAMHCHNELVKFSDLHQGVGQGTTPFSGFTLTFCNAEC